MSVLPPYLAGLFELINSAVKADVGILEDAKVHLDGRINELTQTIEILRENAHYFQLHMLAEGAATAGWSQ